MSTATTGLPLERAHRAQRVFRAVMMAMARPGSIEAVEPETAATAGLDPTLAAVALTLADFETPVWLDAGLRQDPSIAAFIRFHAGAPIADDPARAVFALVSDPLRIPPLSDFAQGEPAYPDRSTTIIARVASLTRHGLRLRGPGIDGEARLGVAPLPPRLVAELAENRARFPLGVDLILVETGRVAALPRSTVVTVASEDAPCT